MSYNIFLVGPTGTEVCRAASKVQLPESPARLPLTEALNNIQFVLHCDNPNYQQLLNSLTTKLLACSDFFFSSTVRYFVPSFLALGYTESSLEQAQCSYWDAECNTAVKAIKLAPTATYHFLLMNVVFLPREYSIGL